MLKRERHLYSAGQPSRWALADILVFNVMYWKYFTVEVISSSASNLNHSINQSLVYFFLQHEYWISYSVINLVKHRHRYMNGVYG